MVFRQRNSQRFEMDMSAAEVKRAARHSRHSPHPPSPTARKSSSAACRPKGSSTSGATRAAPCCTSTTRCTSRTPSSTCWCATSRRPCTPPTATPAPPAKSAWRWSPPGPGVTNAVTGIATAYMDSIPMVIITGQVPTPAIGLDAFQECDTVGITRPIVKHNFLVKDVRDLALTLKKAFHIARTGRPGPVVVDIPKDVSLKTAPFHYPETVEMRSYNPVKKGHGGQIRKAVQLLLQAKRPYIYTGGGVILGNASQRTAPAGRPAGLPLHQHADGPGRHPRQRPALPGHAGHARHLRSQHDDAELRRPARRRRALRRPRDRQPEALRVGRAQDHPRRHRPVVDLQARQGRHPDRRRREGRAAGADRADPRGAGAPRRRGAVGLVEPDQRVAQARLPGLQGQQRGHQAADGGREALAADARPRHLHHLRRRPAPDVGGAVLPLRGAAALDQLRRPGHDGRGPAVCDGHQARQARRRTSSASPAKARSRCASRSCRPACSTRRR